MLRETIVLLLCAAPALAGTIDTPVGSASGDDFPVAVAHINPTGMARDDDGNVYIADTNRGTIRVWGTDGVMHRFACKAGFGHGGDGGKALDAQCQGPGDLAVGNGGLYFVEQGFVRFVKFATGTVEPVAGNGGSGFSGDNGPATAATLNFPSAVAVMPDGALLIADTGNNRIRRVDKGTGNIGPFAGSAFLGGFGGDGGPATAALLSGPNGLAVAPDGTVYVADAGNCRIRKIASDGKISTVAGRANPNNPSAPSCAFAGDDGNALSASLNSPQGVALDANGNLYIADQLNHRIRAVNLASGTITRIAGNGFQGATDGDALKAKLNSPSRVLVISNTILLINDTADGQIRRIDLGTSPPTITPVASATGSPTATMKPTDAPTLTATRTPTLTPTDTATALSTKTSTQTPAATATRTPTVTRTSTPSVTPPPAPPTATATPVDTATRTPSPTPPVTPTATRAFGVSGAVRYWNGDAPVSGVSIQATGASATANPPAVQSDAQGRYGFSALAEGEWQLSPTKAGGQGTAITAMDAVFVLEAAVGQRTLTPNQRMACDVTGNGQVSALDAVTILRYVIGQIPKLPVSQTSGSAWGFAPATLSFAPLQTDLANQDITAVLFGDCTGNWQPPALTPLAHPLHPAALAAVHLGHFTLHAGLLTVPLNVDAGTTQSFTAELNYDTHRLSAPQAKAVAPGTPLVVSNVSPAGVLRVAVASGTPLTGHVVDVVFKASGQMLPSVVKLGKVVVE